MIISMIRPATEGDAQRVAEIYNHYVLSTTVTFEENVVAVATMAQRIAETQRTLPYLVAEDEAQRGNRLRLRQPLEIALRLPRHCQNDRLCSPGLPPPGPRRAPLPRSSPPCESAPFTLSSTGSPLTHQPIARHQPGVSARE
jgi:hypothetical protein